MGGQVDYLVQRHGIDEVGRLMNEQIGAMLTIPLPIALESRSDGAIADGFADSHT